MAETLASVLPPQTGRHVSAVYSMLRAREMNPPEQFRGKIDMSRPQFASYGPR